MNKSDTRMEQRGCVVVIVFALAAVALVVLLLVNLFKPGDSLDSFPVDVSGFVTVANEQKLTFPTMETSNNATDLNSFTEQELFEIVGVLGNPSGNENKMTDTSHEDLWLIVRNHGSKVPKFFIVEVQFREHSIGFFGKLYRSHERIPTGLFTMFTSGKFFEAGRPITMPTGFYLYVEYVYGGSRNIKVCNEVSDEAGLYAKTFTGDPNGRLVLIIKEGFGYSDYTAHILERSQVKMGTSLTSALPDPSSDWLNQSFISWKSVEAQNKAGAK